MKKVIISFLLVIGLLLTGCSCNSGSSNYFFYFKQDSINMKVDESLEIFKLEKVTNFYDFDSVRVYTSDDSKFEITLKDKSSCLLKPKEEGNFVIFIEFKKAGKIIKDNFNLVVSKKIISDNGNSDIGDNESENIEQDNLTYTYTSEKTDTEFDIYSIDVFKSKQAFFDFRFEINMISGTKISEKATGSKIKIMVSKEATFMLTIFDTINNKHIEINSASDLI